MLFGMFFGAGNLIFPAKLGFEAGSNLLIAFLGLFITAVGLPLLAIVALGISRCDGVLELSSKVGKRYGLFFSTLLCLTIGPLFAIPRCASTSFAVGAATLIPEEYQQISLAIFSFLFFAATLFFSLKPNGIMTWIGKILNPLFLACLSVLVIAVLINPIDAVSSVTPAPEYATGTTAFFKGFLEGYNTLDAVAGLVVGIAIINVIRDHGVQEPSRVAANTAKAGIFSCLFMGLIYFFITFISAKCYSVCAGCSDGGAALGAMADHYFGPVGAVLLMAIVTLACLKTAIGLVTCCSESFTRMFHNGVKYNTWAIFFCAISLLIANLGLSTIVAYCVPVLMFLYPLGIVLIFLSIFGKFFDNDRVIYVSTTVGAFIAAIFDFISAFASTLHGSGVENLPTLDAISSFTNNNLPLFKFGLGWVIPAAIGFAVGLVIHIVSKKKAIVEP